MLRSGFALDLTRLWVWSHTSGMILADTPLSSFSVKRGEGKIYLTGSGKNEIT